MALETTKYCPHNSIKAKRKWQGRKHLERGGKMKMWPDMRSEVVEQTFIIRNHMSERDVDV
jgi:hypothetical protein